MFPGPVYAPTRAQPLVHDTVLQAEILIPETYTRYMPLIRVVHTFGVAHTCPSACVLLSEYYIPYLVNPQYAKSIPH